MPEEPVLAREKTPHGPTRLIVATVQTQGEYPVPGGSELTLRGTEVWATYQRRRPEGWTRETEPECFPCDHFWAWVIAHARKRTRVWIVAPRADEFLTLSRFFEQVEFGHISLDLNSNSEQNANSTNTKQPLAFRGSLVVSPRCTIVEAIAGEGRIFIVSANNYLEATDYKVCKATRVDIDTGLNPLDRISEPPVHQRDACIGWTRWCRGTILSWIENGKGNWQPTAAGLAVAAWRATDGPRAARRHNNDEAIDLEVGALHGGRQAAFYVGDCGDRYNCNPNPHPLPPKQQYPTTPCIVDRYDTRSMYPAIMGSEHFPIQLGGFHESPKMSSVKSWCQHECCIASVFLDTTIPEYPARYPRGTEYPIGRFSTVLAGPELIQAFRDKIVKKVFAASRYLPGKPFTNWSEYILSLREQCREDGDILGLWLAKTIAVSFGGRFAMSQRRWVDRNDIDAPILWGEFTRYGERGIDDSRYRALCGRTKQLVVGRPGYRLLAAVYAYLTAYGRMYMRRIRESQPKNLIVSQCTDSLWVMRKDRAPYHTVDKYVGDSPGELRNEVAYGYLRLIDSNRYYADGRWVLSGTPAGFWIDHNSMICAVQSENPLCSLASTRPETITQRVITYPAAQIPTRSFYGPDGWILPPIAGNRSDYITAPYSPGWVKPPREQLVIPGFQQSPHAH